MATRDGTYDGRRRWLRIAMVAPPWYEIPPLGYGGVEQVVAGLVDGLVDRGHDVTLFGAGSETGTKARLAATVGEPQMERLGEFLPEIAHVARANRMIEAGGFDVVHDHAVVGPLTAERRASLRSRRCTVAPSTNTATCCRRSVQASGWSRSPMPNAA